MDMLIKIRSSITVFYLNTIYNIKYTCGALAVGEDIDPVATANVAESDDEHLDAWIFGVGGCN